MRFVSKIFAAVLLPAFCARAVGWQSWAAPWDGVPANNIYSKIALSESNIYFTTLADGIYVASVGDRQFSRMPVAGLPPLWNPSDTNAFQVWHIATPPQNTVVIGLNPGPGASATNTAPLLYWFDETNAQWVASTVHGKSYAYTSRIQNFAQTADGALWTCSGWAPYAYRSTNGGRDFDAFNIDARVPANYLPNPVNGQTGFGKLFGITAKSNEVFIGTETGGYLHTLDNGQTWTSLDPNFTDANSTNPLGRVGNASFGGVDRFGNVVCAVSEFAPFPGLTNWQTCKLIGYRTSDGSFFRADFGIPPENTTPFRIFTTQSGWSYTTTTYTSNGIGGIFRSPDGRNWEKFNDGIQSLAYTNLPANISADCIAVTGTTVLVGYDNSILFFDTMPPPVSNHPPTAFSQSLATLSNAPAAITLTGYDADGDAITFSILQPPSHGSLGGVPPSLVYSPSNGFTGNDSFYFTASDGPSTSAPAIVNIGISAIAITAASIAVQSPAEHAWFVAPTNIFISAIVSNAPVNARVDLYADDILIASQTNIPFATVWTNPAAGHHFIGAKILTSTGGRAWAKPVSIEILAASPRIKIRNAGTNNIVIWPLVLDGFLLESRTNVASPWTLVPQPPLDENYTDHAVTIPASQTELFRLWHP